MLLYLKHFLNLCNFRIPSYNKVNVLEIHIEGSDVSDGPAKIFGKRQTDHVQFKLR